VLEWPAVRGYVVGSLWRIVPHQHQRRTGIARLLNGEGSLQRFCELMWLVYQGVPIGISLAVLPQARGVERRRCGSSTVKYQTFYGCVAVLLMDLLCEILRSLGHIQSIVRGSSSSGHKSILEQLYFHQSGRNEPTLLYA
jgi:hypothetical protein